MRRSSHASPLAPRGRGKPVTTSRQERAPRGAMNSPPAAPKCRLPRMRHEVLAAELIKSLRGKRSQTAFSRHLGYRCNVLYTWESGRRWPTAATFLKVASKARIDLGGGLKRFLGTT